MTALVYRGPGKKVLANRPMPRIAAPTDAIVKIVKTTICGTDLHILKGDVLTCALGRILGHEGVGVIEEIAPAVTAFHAGDRVLISCISACGRCEYCRRGMYSHCTTGGWRTVEARKLDPAALITHRFTLDDILDAYETFGRAADIGALNVIIAA